jgi:outer membrane lipoprotein-sorting protein
MRGKILRAILVVFTLATFSAVKMQAQSPASGGAAPTEAAPAEVASGAAAVSQPAAEKPIPTAEEILVRFVDAAGGREVWGKFNTRWLKGIYQTEDASSFAAIEIFSKSPNKAYTKITFPNGLTLREVCDGKSAWLEDPRGDIHEISGAALESRLQSSTFSNRADILQKIAGARVVGTGRVGSHLVYIVEFAPEKKLTSKIYFDTESGLAVRADDTLRRSDGDYVVETYLDDYREVDGAYFPFRMRHVEKGNVFTIRVTQIKNNPPIDDTMFIRTGTIADGR